MQEIVDAHEFNNSYGIKRMVQELADQYDIHTGEHRVHRLMQKIEYKSVITQSYKGNRGRPVVERDNLVKDIIIERPYQVLTTDVTYLVMPDKQKLYKASVLDWFTG
ncbi:IS3 family transposase, partial [Weissella paramesenteroides]|uniref:IS3 family transposase n=1 Tax=Weissella paramesenteroides TaxID=1249 RepID=UPI00288003BE